MSLPTSRLSAALRVRGPTLVYAVDRITEAVAAIEAAIGEPVVPILCDGALRASVAERRATGRPIVVVLGATISAAAREVLSDLQDDEQGAQIIALSSASTPSKEMWALFPLRLAAVSALEEVCR